MGPAVCVDGMIRSDAPATLAAVTLDCMRRGDALVSLDVPVPVFTDFLDAIERGYDPAVPYHNVEHVKTVVQATSRLWYDGGLGHMIRGLVPTEADVEELALFVAAAVHDHEHRGVTNDFLIRTTHPYAVTHK